MWGFGQPGLRGFILGNKQICNAWIFFRGEFSYNHILLPTLYIFLAKFTHHSIHPNHCAFTLIHIVDNVKGMCNTEGFQEQVLYLRFRQKNAWTTATEVAAEDTDY